MCGRGGRETGDDTHLRRTSGVVYVDVLEPKKSVVLTLSLFGEKKELMGRNPEDNYRYVLPDSANR